METKRIDFWGYLIIITFLSLLGYAAYISYKSIDWTVLTRLESETLVLPSPVVASPSATIATPTAKY